MVRALRLSLVAALLCATGAQWVLLQGVAWTRMSLEHVRAKGVVAAVSAATDGRHPCALCHIARKGAAETQNRQAARASDVRLDFAATSAIAVVRAPAASWIVHSIRLERPDGVAAVELPPPCRLPA